LRPLADSLVSATVAPSRSAGGVCETSTTETTSSRAPMHRSGSKTKSSACCAHAKALIGLKSSSPPTSIALSADGTSACSEPGYPIASTSNAV
jgi:hypothetical protein